MIYPLVKEMVETNPPYLNQVKVTVSIACRVLGFSKQAYYKWRKAPFSARQQRRTRLLTLIKPIHDQDKTLGYRLITDELIELGESVCERTIWAICSQAKIFSITHRKAGKPRPAHEPASDDLVRRKFRSKRPNQVWLTDITEHHTGEGKLYLCAVKETFSNKIIGWAIDRTMTAKLAVDALTDAFNRRGRPKGVIIHSDRGSQFGSSLFVQACRRFGIRRSMGQAYTCADNAAMESFFALLQKNVLNLQRKWYTRNELARRIIYWIEVRYNRGRRQRTLGKRTPERFEAEFLAELASAA